MMKEQLREKFYSNTGFYPSDEYIEQMIKEYSEAPKSVVQLMGYRSKVKLADVSEEFANLCYADGYGCVQSVQFGSVHIMSFPDSDSSARNYLDRRESGTNDFIQCFLQG